MSNLSIYLPQDRLRALVRGETLPDRTTGAALFADISGFTPLTEALRDALGPRRGAEALTHHLDTVYTALIAEVDRFGGSVIGFAGDAITCWFDDNMGLEASDLRLEQSNDIQASNRKPQASPAAPRATACAFALQTAMWHFAAISLPNGLITALAVKVAVASGPARRFAVGDPNIHYLDALAGATVARTATAEHLADKGEVLLDEATLTVLGAAVTVREWRTDAERNERFAVAAQFVDDAIAQVIPEPAPVLDAAAVQAWMPQAVYEREQSGHGAFLTEFRPCVALFVRVVGIDYDADEAASQLDAFVRPAQVIVARYGGSILQLTIGDNGSYAYINLGALSAHEDDPRRALKIALALREQAHSLGFLAPVQIGITLGTLRAGAYGGPTRRTYGALGDDVNLAARLMQSAAPGEIVLSGHVQRAVAEQFSFEPRAPLPMKGKAEPLPIFAVTGERQQRAIRLQEPTYALPMVGRHSELQIISDKLDLVLKGQAQIIGIIADAGMGKSRLVAEVIRLARRKGFAGYGGACQSDALTTPYLAWKPIWSAFFGADPELPLRKQIRSLEGEIEDRAPERVQAVPLLGPLLNMAIAENEFTKTLEPKTRQSTLHALLEDCLKAAASDEPLLLIFEDLHWIDALSHDLLDELARALAGSPICFVLAYRPPQLARLLAPRLEALAQFTKIELTELSVDECAQAIRAKLAQLYPARGGAVPAVLVEKLMARAQGNPFYLEELLNYLRDRGLDPRDPAALDKIELPDSLHTLILSRIDQLSEREKSTLRVASIVGRLFRAAWLTGYYPALGDLPQVKADLDELHSLEITPLDTPEPELAYLFKHIVTHEVTYESLPYATRAQLHEQLAQYLESIGAPLETIAHQYGQSENRAKQREYFQKAGDAAQAAYANDAALEYYARLLPLVTEPREQLELLLTRGDVLQLIGQWAEAESAYQAALAIIEQTHNLHARVRCQRALSQLANNRGDYLSARGWAEQALAGADALADPTLQAQSALALCSADSALGEYPSAQRHGEHALALARANGDLKNVAGLLRILGHIVVRLGNNGSARRLLEESLALARQIRDKTVLGKILNDYGFFLRWLDECAAAQACYTEQLALAHETGDRSEVAFALTSMGAIAQSRGRLDEARQLSEQGLALCRTLGAKRLTAELLLQLSNICAEQGDYASAQRLAEEATELNRETGYKTAIAWASLLLGDLALGTNQLTTAKAHFSESLPLYQELQDLLNVAEIHGAQAVLAALRGQTDEAQRLAAEGLALIRQSGTAVDIADMLSNAGFIACQRQDYSQAHHHYRESLALFWPSEYRGAHWAEAWAGVAMTLLRQTATIKRGVQLAAVAERILQQIGAVLWPIFRAPFDEAVASTRAVLGEQAFDAAWAAGQAMSLEEAIGLALPELSANNANLHE